ncbi:DUF177 domain-containing protein [Sphingomonas sp. BN140010]|uniref:DUF177 domain-containing protein n=1 Tax=Sphingomonas arvum TaxID=2992113 RepID=A0ABT3JF33_9SPHN|nr:DUF177 domain-containing protein [Sphingomonas sp. BN140010]MCW3797687.1 DUF177 domain-containing protein [Sphingomonas sp. BN140010]
MSRFSDALPLGTVRDGMRLDLSANEGERHMIAERLGLAALERLEAHVALERDGERVHARGRIKAALEQSCVATGESVPASVDEPFDILFMPEPTGTPDEEIELSEADCDVVFHDGSSIDLGGALADTLALSLDPYPRSPEAETALREAGVLSEEQAGPFAALAALKKG